MWDKNLTFLTVHTLARISRLFHGPKTRTKKHVGRETIRVHYSAPEVSFRHEGQFLNFVLVSLDYRREIKRHVIAKKILPQFWRVYKANMNKKLLQIPLASISGNCKCFTPSVVALLPMLLGTFAIGKFTKMWDPSHYRQYHISEGFDSKLSDVGNHNSANI